MTEPQRRHHHVHHHAALPNLALHHRLRVRAGGMIVDNLFRGLAAAGKLHPYSRPEKHRVTVDHDIPYRSTGSADHRLDVYRPSDRPGPLPVVLYVHGGGFRILSKDTHWLMGLAFARQGYLVVNINYRLAPRHPFPAAVEDVCAAFGWVLDNAPRLGGDLGRLVFAGESAGANLVTALTVATHYRRPEPFAALAFDRGVTARAVLPACGVFQVSDPGRFGRRKQLPSWLTDRLLEVSAAYLGAAPSGPTLDLADPLLLLERGERPERPLPPFFLPVGTADLLLDDTRRLQRALADLGGRAEARYYKGGVHAFHAFVFQELARQCWRDQFAFLDDVLGGPP